MNASGRILVTLATSLALPIVILAGAFLGIAVALKFIWFWLGFVWEEL